MELQIIGASEEDLIILTEMNRQLIADEGSENPMNDEQLRQRMQDWILGDWNVDLLLFDNTVIGYALYQFRSNPYHMELKDVYLRQYFIKREYRNNGHGITGIEKLKQERFKGIQNLEIDVLQCNMKGQNFWRKAGFMPHYVNMRMNLKNS
ncbi:GNAT family N-acetyltransferase [Cohnella herbarum]|uniref:GNAT family N-acetyltransferase n=1 Tax=Cohnella herbarum TaxID=2728023 RepID=A0A7Z2VHC8_9BACL|nr:GNAT family N-acetyltransferase [Cohnella herbarum]QJD83216.1 GNAT family N-acetyltransferase [Cohnella herbarum]